MGVWSLEKLQGRDMIAKEKPEEPGVEGAVFFTKLSTDGCILGHRGAKHWSTRPSGLESGLCGICSTRESSQQGWGFACLIDVVEIGSGYARRLCVSHLLEGEVWRIEGY
jgi:hypothetical protein